MPVNCSVFGCSAVSNKNLCLSFHSFPKDKGLLQEWIVKLRHGKTPSKYSRVCSRHFTEDDFNLPLSDWGSSKNRYLKPRAVPSQNLPVSSHPSCTFTTNGRGKRSAKRIALSQKSTDVNNGNPTAPTIEGIPEPLAQIDDSNAIPKPTPRELIQVSAPTVMEVTSASFIKIEPLVEESEDCPSEVMEVTSASFIKIEPLVEESEDCPSEAMEVTPASVIKIEPLVEESEDCPSEGRSRTTSPVQCVPEAVFLVMPKSEPDYPEPEESIKEEYPEYISPEVCIEEENGEESDILLKCADLEEPDNIITPGTRQFWCSVCNKGFLRKAHLLRHMPVHNEQKDFKCGVCLKEFTEKCSLKNHLLTHSNKKAFQCTICSRGYSQKSSLKKHVVAQHTKTQMIHSCTVCGRHFPDVQSLQDHARSHIQLKKYTCKICSHDFCDKSGLNKHMVVHSKEKRFECPHCKKKFGRSDHLKIHIRVHTGEREHACPTCGKTFNLKSVLVKHLLVHTKEKKYQCPHCFKKFGRVDHFNVHLVKQHAINDTSCKESETITP